MARSRRSGRASARRGGREEVPEALEFAEPERPRRSSVRGRPSSSSSGGGMIGLVIPMIVTLIATVALLLTGFLTANAAKKGMEQVLDRVGVGTALALSAFPTDWYREDHGTTSFWTLFEEQKQRLMREAASGDDERLVRKVENDFKEFVENVGLEQDTLEQSRLDQIRMENRDRLRRILGEGSPILHAEVIDANNALVASTGTTRPKVGDARNERTIAGVTLADVPVGGAPGRIYQVKARDALGAEDGRIRLYLSARAPYEAAKGLTGTFLLLSLVGIVLVGGVSFFLCLSASKGIRNVTSDLNQVAGGDLDVRITTRGGGEVGSLARAADRAMKTFRAVQEQSVEAASVQPVAPVEAAVDSSTLLPGEPPKVDGYEIEAVHKPCPAAANDYYDYLRVDDTHIGIVIADMPHSGPQGAFAASTFRALMRAYAPEETSPAAVLSRVNRVMADELKRGDHVTAMYAVLDTEKGIAAVASAGHLPLIFWKLEKKGSALLNPEGIAIGLDKGPVFEKTVVDKRIKLDRGDRIVLYTDGPVAAESASGEEFGEQRFYYLVSREAPKNSAAFVNFVANEVDLFHEGAQQQDDITIVTLRKVGA